MAQGIWTPTRGTDSTPNWVTGTNWNNPHAQGLVHISRPAVGMRDFQQGQSNGTRPVALGASAALGFGTQGVSFADAFMSSFSGSPAHKTVLVRMAINSYSDRARVFDKRVVSEVEVLYIDSITGSFTYSIVGTGSQRITKFTPPPYGPRPFVLVLTANNTSPNNPADARLFINGVEQTRTTESAGSGTTVTNADPFVFGNRWNDKLRGLDGAISDIIFWDRIFQPEEVREVSATFSQLYLDDSDTLIFDMGAGGGAVTASGSLAAVSLTAAAGTATGGASASSALAAVSLGAAQASAMGGASASGSIDAIDLSPANGAATAGATATGALDAVDLTPVSGTASGGAVVPGNASGSLAPVSLAAVAGSASAAANAAAVFASLAINPATGAAYGAAVAVGGLPVIALSPATATATGGASIAGNASGAFAGISLSAITGTANDLEASASPYVAFVPYTNHIAFVPSSTTTAVRGL